MPNVAMPEIEPMVRAAKPPFGKAGWLWELKVDGGRLMACIDSPHVRLVTRRGRKGHEPVPRACRVPGELVGVETAILDVVLVACSQNFSAERRSAKSWMVELTKMVGRMLIAGISSAACAPSTAPTAFRLTEGQ